MVMSRFISFMIAAFLMSFLMHYYVWHRVIKITALPRMIFLTFSGIIWSLFIALPLSMGIGRYFFSSDTGFFVLNLSFIWLGILYFLVMVLFIFECVYWAYYILFRILDLSFLEKKMYLIVKRVFAISSVLIATIGVSSGIHEVRKDVDVKQVKVKLPRFPESLGGFKIIQISDFHIGMPLSKRDTVETVVKKINDLNPDLVVLTGDIVDGSVPTLKDIVAPIRNLKTKYGVFLATGNHEYYASAPDWIDEFSSLGIRMLLNESIVIGNQGAAFELAGIPDYNADKIMKTHEVDLGRTFKDHNPDLTTILISHQPKIIYDLDKYDVGLVLSGHTHGGQIWPWGLLVHLTQPYIKGLHKYKGRTQVYVSQGTGYWGPPMRIGTKAEITLITIDRGEPPDCGEEKDNCDGS
ncbi:MAG: metallophosphoesterase [Oligoflexales bacterium]|nr:metallophosphoesterase [Oligoflexales bacterium]